MQDHVCWNIKWPLFVCFYYTFVLCQRRRRFGTIIDEYQTLGHRARRVAVPSVYLLSVSWYIICRRWLLYHTAATTLTKIYTFYNSCRRSTCYTTATTAATAVSTTSCVLASCIDGHRRVVRSHIRNTHTALSQSLGRYL